jgi:drug/metabolite transporter (DMT)-like permease
MGETAALVTAFCWAFSSVFFTAASKVAGAIPVNRIRLIIAVFLLLIVHTLITGQLLPFSAEPDRWLWLGLSGIVGLVLGDTFLFQAYILIGNRLGTLLMAAVPVISSLGAWIFLGEELALPAWFGMVLCTGGIIIVVMERKNGNGGTTPPEKRQFFLGILCAIGGAVGQAGGLILAKKGLADNFPSISGVMIRMLIAMIFIWVITILMGQARQSLIKVFTSSKTIFNITGGSIVGPFLGVWLSQIALQKTYVGIASTLMALTPIIMLPISKWYYKENVSYRALIGTCIALAGVVIIFIL